MRKCPDHHFYLRAIAKAVSPSPKGVYKGPVMLYIMLVDSAVDRTVGDCRSLTASWEGLEGESFANAPIIKYESCFLVISLLMLRS